jgi:hypothetical protein
MQNFVRRNVNCMQELKQWFNIQQFIDLSYIHMLTIKRIKNAPVSQLPSTQKKNKLIGLAAICWVICKLRNRVCFKQKLIRLPTEIVCYASIISITGQVYWKKQTRRCWKQGPRHCCRRWCQQPKGTLSHTDQMAGGDIWRNGESLGKRRNSRRERHSSSCK